MTTILHALEVGATRSASAGSAGISRETFYRWLHARRGFEDAVAHAEAEAEVRAVALIQRAAQRGSWRAAAWWLERRFPPEYGPVPRLDFRVDLEAEVRRLAAENGLDFESAMTEVKAILLEARRNPGGQAF